MNPALLLAPDALASALASLHPDWQHDTVQHTVCREFVFADFAQAFGCMSELALLSERCNHHPEWFNVYARLRITLHTHEAGGLTQRDIDWARYADAAFLRHSSHHLHTPPP